MGAAVGTGIGAVGGGITSAVTGYGVKRGWDENKRK